MFNPSPPTLKQHHSCFLFASQLQQPRAAKTPARAQPNQRNPARTGWVFSLTPFPDGSASKRRPP